MFKSKKTLIHVLFAETKTDNNVLTMKALV
jgi:hypothetical protein